MGFDDHLWNGVTTRQFAEVCHRLIGADAFDQLRKESGTYHFCPNPVTTKYELLCGIRDAAGRSITIRRAKSGLPMTRILGSEYSGLQALYANTLGWQAVIGDMVSDGR
jgi:hypothetical protein